MSTVSLGDITVAYDDLGAGDPLVLVHGHPFDRSMWRPQAEHLAANGWRVVLPDLRGYGETTVVPGTTPLDVFARDLAALLDVLRIDRIVLGGLSMGGQIVLEFYRLFPDRVRALILADTFAQDETEAGKKHRNALADRLLREGMSAYATEVLPKMMTPRNIDRLPDTASHVLEMMTRTAPDGAAAALRGRAERPDYTELLPRVTVPTLVVVGDEDEFTPVRDARFISDRVPGAELAVIEGAGHLPNLEREPQFSTVLTKFLTELSPEQGDRLAPRYHR